MDSTEALGVPKTDGVANEIPECIDGLGERELNIVDKAKEPKLTIAERNKLRSCERPRSKGAWGTMANEDRWGTLQIFKCAFHGQKAEKKEEKKEGPKKSRKRRKSRKLG